MYVLWLLKVFQNTLMHILHRLPLFSATGPSELPPLIPTLSMVKDHAFVLFLKTLICWYFLQTDLLLCYCWHLFTNHALNETSYWILLSKLCGKLSDVLWLKWLKWGFVGMHVCFHSKLGGNKTAGQRAGFRRHKNLHKKNVSDSLRIRTEHIAHTYLSE